MADIKNATDLINYMINNGKQLKDIFGDSDAAISAGMSLLVTQMGIDNAQKMKEYEMDALQEYLAYARDHDRQHYGWLNNYSMMSAQETMYMANMLGGGGGCGSQWGNSYPQFSYC